jgi:hypothetical protein
LVSIASGEGEREREVSRREGVNYYTERTHTKKRKEKKRIED